MGPNDLRCAQGKSDERRISCLHKQRTIRVTMVHGIEVDWSSQQLLLVGAKCGEIAPVDDLAASSDSRQCCTCGRNKKKHLSCDLFSVTSVEGRYAPSAHSSHQWIRWQPLERPIIISIYLLCH